MKALYIDLETTGTLHWRHDVHQISGCIEIDNVVLEEFDYKLMTVARQLGLEIDESKLHDASYDILLTRSIYKLITN